MPSVTYGTLQSALLEGLAMSAPELVQEALPHLVRLLRNLDVALPAIVIAARAVDLLKKRGGLPTPDAIGGALSRAGREFANTALAKKWMKMKPVWR